MKLFTITLIFISAINLTAQIDTTRKEFYPLQVGNIWQYRDNNDQLSTGKIVRDTIIDGYLYFIQQGGGVRSQGEVMRIDSFMKVQIRSILPEGGDSCGGNTPYEESRYHLYEPDSSVWKVCHAFNDMPTNDHLIRFNSIRTLNVFGQQREVLEFHFGGVTEDNDTILGLGGLLAKGIGVISEHYFEGGYGILQGAIIDGVQYGTIVSVDDTPEMFPERIALYQNYPNPFNPSTKIRYEISQTTSVNLKVLNILGEVVMNLVDEIKYPGSYETEFNASHLSSGVYVAVLQTTGVQLTRSMLLIK